MLSTHFLLFTDRGEPAGTVRVLDSRAKVSGQSDGLVRSAGLGAAAGCVGEIREKGVARSRAASGSGSPRMSNAGEIVEITGSIGIIGSGQARRVRRICMSPSRRRCAPRRLGEEMWT